MKKSLLTLLTLLITTITFSQKEMIIFPENSNLSETFSGTYNTISFKYEKLLVSPSSLQVFVVDMKDEYIVHYVKLEFYQNGKIEFSFLPNLTSTYVVAFHYAPNNKSDYNSLFIRNLKFK